VLHALLPLLVYGRRVARVRHPTHRFAAASSTDDAGVRDLAPLRVS